MKKLINSILVLAFLAYSQDIQAQTKKQPAYVMANSSWKTVALDEILPGLTISLPDSIQIFHEGGYISVNINKNAGMSISKTSYDIAEEKKSLIENSRTNIVYHVSNANEIFYSCEDNTAPKGYTHSNSFVGSKKFDTVNLGVYVDGVTINDVKTKDIYQLPLSHAKLLFGIWKTLKLEAPKK